MNFILVPFLLAIQILEEDNWKHGPEYTFDVQSSMISDLEQDKGTYLGNSLLCKLKCQPNEPESLICRFEDAKFTRLSPRAFTPEETTPPANASYSRFSLGNESFEIKFNDEGIEYYVFTDGDRLKGDHLVNMYRSLANQLSIGTEIEGNQTFRTKENSTVGECSVTFNVSRISPRKYVERRNFRLISLTDSIELNNDEAVEITKTRDLQDCTEDPVYFFGTRYTYGIVLRDTPEKLESSTSRMLITKFSFTADSVNTVGLYNGSKRIGSVLDRIYVSLESVYAAQNKLKPIHNPASFGVSINNEDKDQSI